MCGIAGFFNSNKAKSPGAIEGMLAMIEHRGPDELGFYHDDNIAFGTARLSIIDVKSGQQPLSDHQERYWIAYNGEVYNYKEIRVELEALGHQFATHSDTEVVLLSYIQWGAKALAKFNGGFGLAIYDRLEKSLFLARDKYGKRPLFYTTLPDGTLVFASEMKSFLAHGDVNFAFDLDHLATMATLWTVVPGQSGYKGISQLEPGHWLLAKDQQVKSSAYFSLSFNGEQTSLSYPDAVEKTRTLLENAVKIRLRSDVEVGTYLSGGLDSSITTYLACKNLTRKVRSFSIAFEEAHFDEDTYQKEVSAHLGTNHECLRITNKDIANAFVPSVWHGEVPVFRNAMVPMYLLSEMVRKSGIKVVLTGEGADECFLGYDIFKETKLRKIFSQLSAQEKETRISGLYPWMSHFTSGNARLQVGLFDRFSEEKIENAFSHEIRMHNSMMSLRLFQGLNLKGGLPTAVLDFLTQNKSELSQLSDVQKAQLLEFYTLLNGYLLSSQGDRMSFAHGVESRCPFLDPNVVSWAASLPEDFKLKNGTREKAILKDAYADVLPSRIIERFKQPYRAPDAVTFLSKGHPDFVDSLLSEAELKKTEILDHGFVQNFVQSLSKKAPEQISPREDQTFIFLLSLQVLQRKFVKREGLEIKTSHLKISRIDGRQLKKRA